MWKWKKTEETAVRLEGLGEAMRRVEKALAEHAETQTQTQETHMQSLGEQIGKLTRLQYKSAQDVQNRLDRLNGRLDEAALAQEKQEALLARLGEKERSVGFMIEGILVWLDELDSACAGLNGEESQEWRALLRGWAARLLDMLAEVGVHELPVLGQPFDPVTCEAVATRRPRAGEAPYQIVEVVRRGFANADGKLLRRAHVLTVEEENKNEV